MPVSEKGDYASEHSALSTRSSPLVIGLTGTIAAGKSTVGQLLEERGAVHCDADKLVHRLYDPGTPGFDRVVAAFGPEVVGADGYVDRKVLGAKVFGKPAEMAKLTTAMGSITDAIKGEIDRWRAELAPGDLAVMEAVNLMEPGYARWCDQVWLIGVDDDVAMVRLRETRGMSDEEARQRLGSMRPFEQREPGTDWAYKNNGSLADLRAAVTTELDRIVALHRAGDLPPSWFEPWWQEFVALHRKALESAGQKLADQA
ncbi:MAG: dephospho-CoA kinase [Chloroflexi bacterium]|nr:dephospho-CoA kinase [Chloroflexota bacterium]